MNCLCLFLQLRGTNDTPGLTSSSFSFFKYWKSKVQNKTSILVCSSSFTDAGLLTAKLRRDKQNRLSNVWRLLQPVELVFVVFLPEAFMSGCKAWNKNASSISKTDKTANVYQQCPDTEPSSPSTCAVTREKSDIKDRGRERACFCVWALLQKHDTATPQTWGFCRIWCYSC